jgi:putative addiction module CopG family antidote
MTTTLPPDLMKFVEQELATGKFETESELLIRALELYREMKTRHDALRQEVQASLESADRGEVAPFDIEEVISEVERRSALRRAAK